MAQVHIHHDRRHRGPEHYLGHMITVTELNVPKQKVCHPDMCIYILRFPEPNLSILIHMPRIACTIKIPFQIC